MQLTRHASRRIQQRGIPVDILKIIHAYGSPEHAHCAMSLTLDACAIALASEDDRRLRSRLEKYSGCYAIIGDGERAITVARRQRRFRTSGSRRGVRQNPQI